MRAQLCKFLSRKNCSKNVNASGTANDEEDDEDDDDPAPAATAAKLGRAAVAAAGAAAARFFAVRAANHWGLL